MSDTPKPRLVGINHVALEVGDLAQALEFYHAIFDFPLRGSHENADGRTTVAFLDMGDQFLAISEGRTQDPDEGRHFGLVVDDRSRVRELVAAAGGQLLDGPFLDFLDPWGNRVQIVEYRDLQFTKTDAVLAAMNVPSTKTETARAELRNKGMAS